MYTQLDYNIKTLEYMSYVIKKVFSVCKLTFFLISIVLEKT